MCAGWRRQAGKQPRQMTAACGGGGFERWITCDPGRTLVAQRHRQQFAQRADGGAKAIHVSAEPAATAEAGARSDARQRLRHPRGTRPGRRRRARCRVAAGGSHGSPIAMPGRPLAAHRSRVVPQDRSTRLARGLPPGGPSAIASQFEIRFDSACSSGGTGDSTPGDTALANSTLEPRLIALACAADRCGILLWGLTRAVRGDG